MDINLWESIDSIVIGSAIFDVVLRGESSVIKFNDWIMEEPTGLVEPNEKGYETVMSVKKYYKSIGDNTERQYLIKNERIDCIIDELNYYLDEPSYTEDSLKYHTRLENVLTERLTTNEVDSVWNLLENIIRSKDDIIKISCVRYSGMEVDYMCNPWWKTMNFKQPEPKYEYQCSIFVAGKRYVTDQWPYYKKTATSSGEIIMHYTPAYDRLRLLLNRIRNKYAPTIYLKFDPYAYVNLEID